MELCIQQVLMAYWLLPGVISVSPWLPGVKARTIFIMVATFTFSKAFFFLITIKVPSPDSSNQRVS